MRSVRERGIGPRSPAWRAGGLPLTDSRVRHPRLERGSPARNVGMLPLTPMPRCRLGPPAFDCTRKDDREKGAGQENETARPTTPPRRGRTLADTTRDDGERRMDPGGFGPPLPACKAGVLPLTPRAPASGAGVEPAGAPRSPPGIRLALAARCLAVRPAGFSSERMCPGARRKPRSVLAAFYCASARDLLPRGLTVSPDPPGTSRPSSRSSCTGAVSFRCRCLASRPPGLCRAASCMERGLSSATSTVTVGCPQAPGLLLSY